MDISLQKDYRNWLSDIKSKILQGRLTVAISANNALLQLYWELGKEIVEKEKNANWGQALIEQLSIDLKIAFPEVKGFSRRNLYAIRQWFLFYSTDFKFVPQAVAQIPWGHNRLIISKIKNTKEALFYATACIKEGWSRDILEIQIEQNFYKKAGNAISNFNQTLASPISDLAGQTLKDPYHFDFTGLRANAQERDVEQQLIIHIEHFLLALGKGFAFVGRQYKIDVNHTEYFIDMLFYHLELRCFIVIELKTGKFKPEHIGKLNFYLSAVDTQLKKEFDNPSIGLLLCKSKDKIEVEYSLRDIKKPIGIADYILTNVIPEEIKSRLPTVEQIEQELTDKKID